MAVLKVSKKKDAIDSRKSLYISVDSRVRISILPDKKYG
jgi:hypothetical protein